MMKAPPTDICPLLALSPNCCGPAVCIKEHCAWWNFGGNECVIVTAATAFGELAASMEDMQQNPKRL